MMRRIEQEALSAVDAIVSDGSFGYEIPNRSQSNQVDEKDHVKKIFEFETVIYLVGICPRVG